MKIENVRKLLHAEPFKPFLIHMADGGTVEVLHEDFVAIPPSGRELTVYQSDDNWVILETTLITQLEVGTKPGGKQKRRKDA